MDRIGALVRSAVGFDQRRGDQVEIVNLRFAESPAMAISEPAGWTSMFQFTKADIMQAIQMAVMGLLSALVLLFVVRPLVRRAITPDEHARALLASPPAAVVESPAAPAAVAVAATPAIPIIPSETSKMIDIAQVKGQVHAQSIQKVGELADANPAETVAVIRGWLHGQAA
jgi:flagellar M-ring protein FliF